MYIMKVIDQIFLRTPYYDNVMAKNKCNGKENVYLYTTTLLELSTVDILFAEDFVETRRRLYI